MLDAARNPRLPEKTRISVIINVYNKADCVSSPLFVFENCMTDEAETASLFMDADSIALSFSVNGSVQMKSYKRTAKATDDVCELRDIICLCYEVVYFTAYI